MQISLEGKIALVTGASSGIGETVALALADSGASVVLAARRMERLESLAKKIEDKGGEVLAVRMDVSDRTSVKVAFDTVAEHLGVPDIIINSAGISELGNFLTLSDEKRDKVLQINYNGVWNVGQEAAQRLVKADKGGSIVNIASVLGYGVQRGYSAYTSSKGAVLQLTRNMAVDLINKGIRVNAIAPGWFKTEMNEDYFNSQQGQDYIKTLPTRRLGRLEELIGPVVFLASDAASFVNGTILPVDGGHHTWMV